MFHKRRRTFRSADQLPTFWRRTQFNVTLTQSYALSVLRPKQYEFEACHVNVPSPTDFVTWDLWTDHLIPAACIVELQWQYSKIQSVGLMTPIFKTQFRSNVFCPSFLKAGMSPTSSPDSCNNSVAFVRERTIPIERQSFVSEVSANFCGLRDVA
jgi:hypothetical protein